VISDADVWIEPRFLSRLLGPLADDPSIGLVNCFYELAGPTSLAMKWEALAINADFWSQVLQSKDLKPLDFALGAVMATRKTQVRDIGGFEAIADCLADDYQLGNRIARGGHRIDLQPLVARCFSAPMGWRAVWKHQLRWARTIRVCQPVPYFFSILSNPALWPLLWALTSRSTVALGFLAAAAVIRVVSAADLQKRLAGNWPSWHTLWLASLKDLAQVALWFLAFSGNTVEWRGRKMRLDRDGKLVPNTELGTSNIEL
jgi:ceramide glucosyltransferase